MVCMIARVDRMGRTVKMQKESVWVVMGPRPINVDALHAHQSHRLL